MLYVYYIALRLLGRTSRCARTCIWMLHSIKQCANHFLTSAFDIIPW